MRRSLAWNDQGPDLLVSSLEAILKGHRLLALVPQ